MTESLDSLPFWQLVAICGAAFGGFTALATAIGFAFESALARTRKIFDLPRRPGQLEWELRATLRFVLLAAFAFAILLSYVPFTESSAAAFFYTFVSCWFGFEVYYWGLHRLLHHRAFYRFHRYHHESRVTSPLTGYSMSTVESLGWLIGLTGVPFLASQFAPLSLAGFVTYHAFYQIGGNVIGHANVDFFPAAVAKYRNSWISHPIVYHSLHHARLNQHYAFGSTFMDRIMGTEVADWRTLHGRIVAGDPLRHLAERGSPETPDEPAVSAA